MLLLGGGAVADTYPLQLVESDTSRVSVPPVAGCEFPAVFWGKVAFDAVGLGVGPPCFRVDLEEALLKRTDVRAPLDSTAPAVTKSRMEDDPG